MSSYRDLIKKIANDAGLSTMNVHFGFSNAIENYAPPRPFASSSPQKEIYNTMITETESHPDSIPVYFHDEWIDIIEATIKAYRNEKIGEIPESELGFSWETS